MKKENMPKKVSKHHGFKKTDKNFFPKNMDPGKTGISREPQNFRNFFS